MEGTREQPRRLSDLSGLDRPNLLVSPRYADNLECFPPTYLACGAGDTLLPQTFDFARALVDAGVSTTVSILPEVDHFIRIRPRPPQVTAEVERMAARLLERTAT